MNELLKLMINFYKQNKSLVISSVFFQILHSVLQSIIIPFILAGAFNNINNLGVFKNQLLQLVGLWIIINIVSSISLHFHNKIEPEISKYVILSVINSVFIKYEKVSHITNTSLIIDKLHLIKNNLHDITFISCTVFIPRLIVLFISCITFLSINIKLGLIIFFCVILQYLLLSKGLTKCVKLTYAEHEKKDKMYDYIEDLFSNINIIQSTFNGYDFELEKLRHITEMIKKSEFQTSKCVNTKQYTAFGTNIGIFSFIFLMIYNMHKSGELSSEKTTTIILLVIALFENMSDMSYYIPEFTHRLGILKSNSDFLKELLVKHAETKNTLGKLDDAVIEFKNISFKYPGKHPNFLLNNFNGIIPSNKIVSIYGKSGVGKTTFMKLIFGIMEPTSGSILLGGKNINDYDIKDIRKYISYINQDTNNLFNRTIFENITYGKNYTDSEKTQILTKLKNVFTEFNLYDIFKSLDIGKHKWSFFDANTGKLGSKLSGGQKKLVHLLRLELNDFSKIVIMDEPTSSLDDNTRNNIISYLKYLNSKGKTIIVITHDDHFKNISDKILQFTEGENPRFIK